MKEPRRISAREGALETAEPAADMKPNGISASSALIDARRTRPVNELSLATLARIGEEDLFAAWSGEKVGEGGDAESCWTSGVVEDMMARLGAFGARQRLNSLSIAQTRFAVQRLSLRETSIATRTCDWAFANLVAMQSW